MKEAIAKINKTKSWLFQKIHKIVNINQTHQEKEREDSNQ